MEICKKIEFASGGHAYKIFTNQKVVIAYPGQLLFIEEMTPLSRISWLGGKMIGRFEGDKTSFPVEWDWEETEVARIWEVLVK